VTQDPSPALSVALAYYHAWTGKDIDRAMAHVADDVVCEAPTGRIDGVERFRQFMAPFAQMLMRSDLIAAFGDDRTAVLVYNPHTTLVQDAPSAECFTVTTAGSSTACWSSTGPRSTPPGAQPREPAAARSYTSGSATPGTWRAAKRSAASTWRMRSSTTRAPWPASKRSSSYSLPSSARRPA
jgi:SnoaL-like domain